MSCSAQPSQSTVSTEAPSSAHVAPREFPYLDVRNFADFATVKAHGPDGAEIRAFVTEWLGALSQELRTLFGESAFAIVSDLRQHLDDIVDICDLDRSCLFSPTLLVKRAVPKDATTGH